MRIIYVVFFFIHISLILAGNAIAAPAGLFNSISMIKSSDAGWNDGFGGGVVMSDDGTVLAVSASTQTIGDHANQGSVYVYEKTNGLWVESQKLVAPDGTTGDWFGQTMEISRDGKLLAISTLFNSQAGAVYVYEKTGSDWSYLGRITEPTIVSGHWFGRQILISNSKDKIVISAPYGLRDGRNYQGAAYVFKRLGNTWIKEAELVASDPAVNAYFGEDIDISADGHLLVVGARGQSSVYLFEYSGGRWVQAQKLTGWFDSNGSEFGLTVGFSRNSATLAVGSRSCGGYTCYPDDAMYLFDYTNNRWNLSGRIVATDSSIGSLNLGQGSGVGRAWKLSADGQTIVIGAPGVTINGNDYQGAVYVYRKLDGQWSQSARIVDENGHAREYYGQNINLSADAGLSIIGVRDKRLNFEIQGAAWVYAIENQGATFLELLTDKDPHAFEYFGEGSILTPDGRTLAINVSDKIIEQDSKKGVVFVYSQYISTAAKISVSDKVYDSSASATITKCELTAIDPGDTVNCSASSANFADANAGTNKTVTATGIALAGADAGKYTLTNTTATTTANILKAPATVTLANLSQTYTGSPLSPSASTSPASLAFTWSGAPQTNAGSYAVTATVKEQNYQGSASGTFAIKPKAATVTLSNLSRTYTGSPLSPTVTTNPAGLSVSLTGAPQTNAGSYPVTASITNPNYSGTASGTFVIAKAAQAPVYLNAPAWVRYQQSGLLVSGFGGTGTGTFTYSSTGSSACTVHPTSGVLTITSGTGTCQVTATRQGDTNYLPASSAATSIQVNKALQAPLTISANPPSINSGGPAATLSASGGSTGAPVTYTAVGTAGLTCTISGNTLKATGSAGTCSVTGTMAGNSNYEPVSSAPLAVKVLLNVAPIAVNDSFTLLVTGITPVTVAAPGVLFNDTDANRDALKVVGSTPRTITLASSGGRVTLQQNGSFTYTPPSTSFSGTRSFTYQATDGKLTSNTATVTLAIARRPTANADTTATALNTAKVISVLANDSATAPATLNPASLVITSAPANGIAQANANGTVTYTPTTGFAGTNTFSYTVKDTLGSTSNPATVSVHVPQARNDNYSFTANTSTSQTGNAASVGLNDVPNVSGRTFSRLSNPIRTSGSGTGTLTITSFNTGTGTFSYRLSGTQANKRGTFQFTYRMSLGGVNTAAATVTIVVR